MTTSAAADPLEHDLVDDEVVLPSGLRLAVRRADGAGRPFLLVHGLASNSRLWDGVARRLAAAGHAVVAVDQRGHGRSDVPADGYDTDTCADDLAALVRSLGWAAGRAPVVAGQSWGGNVVLSLAARHPGAAAAVACVDGGWIHLSDRFATFDECWQALAPPVFDGLRWDDVEARIRAMAAGWPPEGVAGTLANLERLPTGGVRARLSREHHRSIVRSLFDADPRRWYPRVQVPVLLCPAIGERPEPDETAFRAAGREAVADALAGLRRVRVRWYPGAHHDIHAEQPAALAADLLAFAAEVEAP